MAETSTPKLKIDIDLQTKNHSKMDFKTYPSAVKKSQLKIGCIVFLSSSL